MSPYCLPDRAPANFTGVSETFDALKLRQETELRELQELHALEIQIRVDVDPEHLADVERDHTREYSTLLERHDNERKRYIIAAHPEVPSET